MAIADSAQVATLKAAKVAGRVIASAQRLVERAHQAVFGFSGMKNFFRSVRPLSDRFADYHGLSLTR
jgi:hypothetical protein